MIDKYNTGLEAVDIETEAGFIDNMNGEGVRNFKIFDPFTKNLNAFSAIKIKSPYNSSEGYANDPNYFFFNFWYMLIENKAELYKFKNMPVEIDIYSIFWLLLTKGQAGFINILGKWHVVDIALNIYEKKEKTTYEFAPNGMQQMPAHAQILNSTGNKLLEKFKNIDLEVGKEIFVIRGSLSRLPLYNKIAPYLQNMANAMAELNTNIIKNGSNIIAMNLKSDKNDSNDNKVYDNFKDNLYNKEKLGMISLSSDIKKLLENFGLSELFNNVEITDKTISCINVINYNWDWILKICGFRSTAGQAKKERLITNEQDAFTEFTLTSKMHLKNIVNNDLRIWNKAWKFNIELIENNELESDPNEPKDN